MSLQRLVPAELRPLVRWRYGGLLLLAAVYILGNFVWAIYSWTHGIGPLPALHMRYVVAGVPAAGMVVIAAMFAVRMPRLILKTWPARLAQKSKWKRRGSLLLVALLGAAFFGLSAWLNLVQLCPAGAECWVTPLIFVFIPISLSLVGLVGLCCMLVLCSLIALWDAATTRGPKADTTFDLGWWWKSIRRGARLGVSVLPSAIAAFGFLLFASEGYSKLPEELGGARPRCAVLDLLVAEYSRPTLAGLGLGGVGQGASHTALQTETLRIFFASPDYLVVGASGDKAAPKFQLSRLGVRAIQPMRCPAGSLAAS